jgi:hypothetical protein
VRETDRHFSCRHHIIFILAWCLLLYGQIGAQHHSLPVRESGALTGTAFSLLLDTLKREARDSLIQIEVLKGNVPAAMRNFVPVTVQKILREKEHTATFFVAADYCAVGADDDFFYTPLSPRTAQHIADSLVCCLPTTAMVDAIYEAAQLKLCPAPIPPTAAMTTVPIFRQHNAFVRAQKDSQAAAIPRGSLTAGHKKDVVISVKCPSGKVAIYGWHRLDGRPIQPLYTGHTEQWVDYSHGIRFVSQMMIVDGERTTVANVLADSLLCGLISAEGMMQYSRYGEQ